MKMLKTAMVTSALVLSCNVHASLVSATYNTEDIVYTYVAPGAVDTYGLGIYEFNFGSSVSVSYTYDNDSANATSVFANPPDMSYSFFSPTYNAALIIDGVDILSSNRSAITLVNNVTQSPGNEIPQYFIDAGFPPQITSPVDGLWMGGYSDDFTYGPAWDGLIFSVDFLDLSGDWLTSSDVIPTLAPDLTTIDLAVLTISQYENNVLQFEAAGIVVNNLSAVPIPAAAWLFGSGLIGLLSFTRHKRT